MVVFLAIILFLVPIPAAAADWVEFRSGPFEVLSNDGERPARETLNDLEQLRYALGWQLGQTELQTTWPIRVLIMKKRSPVFPMPKLGRDAYMCSTTELTPETIAGVVGILLESWQGHLPDPIHRGLVSFYSTVQIHATRVTLGAVPAHKDRDWTRAHMLSVHPDFSGKLRVLLANLGKGMEGDIAYRNAFGMTAEQVERAVDRYMEAGNYTTIMAPSRAMNARQFYPKDVLPAAAQVAQADLLFAQKQPGARAAYEAALKSAPDAAAEGLGLVGAGAHYLPQSKGARGLLEYAKTLQEAAAKRAALSKAADANPRWAEPHKLIAEVETHPAQKLVALRKAAQLEPRVPQNWVALAQVQESAKLFAEAAKSWAAAENATDDPNERERVRQMRLMGERKRDEERLAAADEARRRAAQELEDLRNNALREIRKAEAKANAGKEVVDHASLSEYKEGPETKKVKGALARVDCLVGGQARLHITAGKQTVRVLVPDPGKVAITGGGERSFGCGIQKPARAVTIEFKPRADAKQSTTGDAVTIEFH